MGQHTVLVVEDENKLREMLERRLQEKGFKTFVASDGDEGLVIAQDEHPDLILLDIMMPHDGLEMLNALRQDELHGKTVPVIFLTNLSPDSDKIVKAIEEHEPVFYLIKANYTLEQVIGKVEEALANKRNL